MRRSRRVNGDTGQQNCGEGVFQDFFYDDFLVDFSNKNGADYSARGYICAAVQAIYFFAGWASAALAGAASVFSAAFLAAAAFSSAALETLISRPQAL